MNGLKSLKICGNLWLNILVFIGLISIVIFFGYWIFRTTAKAKGSKSNTSGYCGPIALSLALRWYRVEISPDSLAKLAKMRAKGSTMLDLALAARSLGFEAAGAQTDYSGLQKIPLPAIVHLRDNHYAVVIGVNPDSLLIEDNGRRFFEKRVEFEKEWKGFVLIIYPKRGVYLQCARWHYFPRKERGAFSLRHSRGARRRRVSLS
ncbi:MAG: cysteine peptidase family C39 domain-containing protein [Candidatus Edwardsbacteria bacterium]